SAPPRPAEGRVRPPDPSPHPPAPLACGAAGPPGAPPPPTTPAPAPRRPPPAAAGLPPTRRRILTILRKQGEATVDDLSRRLGITASGVRQHLSGLTAGGRVV